MSQPQAPALGPMSGAPMVITAIALALGTFMQVLDTTIANVSLPTIVGNLGASTSQGTWVVTAFAAANGISVPLTGWLMQRYGVVRTFVTSVLLFTAASFLCGAAWSLPVLIVFRVLQGAVSGPMIPGSQALLLSIFPAEKRSAALGIWAMTTLTAPIMGPILGGYISDNVSWRWIFYINIPIGVACAFIAWRMMKARETPSRRLPVDMVGIALLAVWVACLQIMLDLGKDYDWFSSPLIVGLAVVSAVAFVAWLIWELTETHPIVDLSLFKSRNFAIGCIALALSYAIFFGNGVLLPLWLQTDVGYIATWAGLVAAPSGMVAVFLTPIAARITQGVDARISASFAMLTFALSFYMRSLLSDQANFGAFVLPMLVQGVAMSTFFVALMSICLRDIPPERTPFATGLSNFARITAGGLGASVTTTLWSNGATRHQTRIAETAGPAMGRAVAQMQGMGMSHGQAVAAMTRQVGVQASSFAAVDFFRASAYVCVALLPLIWITRRVSGAGGAHAAAD